MNHQRSHRRLLAVAAGLGFGLASAVTAGATAPPDTEAPDERPCDEFFAADMTDMTDIDDMVDETEPMDDMGEAMPDETEPMDEITDEDEPAIVQVANTEWGEILVDAACGALYVFIPDAGQDEATCVGDCAVAWPPMALFAADPEDVSVPPVADELDADLFGFKDHPEVGPVLTVADWPLYYFADDQQAGDINGQGLNDVWFVVSPDGEPIEQMPEDEMELVDEDDDLDEDDDPDEEDDDEEDGAGY